METMVIVVAVLAIAGFIYWRATKNRNTGGPGTGGGPGDGDGGDTDPK